MLGGGVELGLVLCGFVGPGGGFGTVDPGVVLGEVVVPGVVVPGEVVVPGVELPPGAVVLPGAMVPLGGLGGLL